MSAIAASTQRNHPTLDPEALLPERIAPVRASPLYLLALMLVAATMILLPLIYLGIIGLAGYGVYYHATENAWLLSAGGMRFSRGVMAGRLVGYGAPLIIGGILVIFMLKPLLARRPREHSGLALRPEDEPRLFAFVDRLCSVVRAPRPREIKVDCQANASAAFRRGFLSLLMGDLTLTIGLPLAAGLTLRELSGVLAHEFGHFSQRFAMRFGYVINRVNGWFARVVYERDELDEWLYEESHGDTHWVVSLTMYVARLVVWLTRRVLWLLMMIGHAVSCFVSRRMEYNADAYEVRLAGAAAFESTSQKVVLLSFAEQATERELNVAWREKRLPDNLPAMIAAKTDALRDGPAAEKIREFTAQQRTGMLDTHPSTANRVRAARRLGDEGVFVGDGPADELFSDFEAICRTLTFIYYRDAIGEEIQQQNLVKTARMVAERKTETAKYEGAEAFLGYKPTPEAPFAPSEPALQPVPDARQALAELKLAHAEWRRVQHQAPAAIERIAEAEAALQATAAANVLLRAKMKFQAREFGLKSASADGVRAARQAAESTRAAALETLRAVHAALSHRMLCALRILHLGAIRKRIGMESDELRRLDQALAVCVAIRPFVGEVSLLQQDLAVADIAGRILSADAQQSEAHTMLRAAAQSISERLTHARRALADHRYPFEYATGEISVGAFLIPEMPFAGSHNSVFPAAGTYLNNLGGLYMRLLLHLADAGHRVETLLKVADAVDAAAEAAEMNSIDAA